MISVKDSYLVNENTNKINVNLLKKIDLKNDFKYGIFIFEDISIVEDSLTKEQKILYKNYIFNFKKEATLHYK